MNFLNVPYFLIINLVQVAIHLRFSQILSGCKKDFKKWRYTERFSQIWLQTRHVVQIFNQPSVFMDAR